MGSLKKEGPIVSKSQKLKWFGLAVGLAFGGLVFGGQGGQARAQAPDSPPPTTYEYVARPGDNLSYMVRRSVQLYSKAKNTPVSPAAAMFCETHVVQQLGSRYLDINEAVAVPFDSLQQYIEQSKSLTPAQLAAWDYYANRASFDLPGLNPTNLEAAKKVTTPQASSTNTEADQAQSEAKQNQLQNKTPLAWYWWAVGMAVLGVIYYALDQRLRPAPVRARAPNRPRRRR